MQLHVLLLSTRSLSLLHPGYKRCDYSLGGQWILVILLSVSLKGGGLTFNKDKRRGLSVHDYSAAKSMETNAKGQKNVLSSPSKSPVLLKKQKGAADIEDGAILQKLDVLTTMIENLGRSGGTKSRVALSGVGKRGRTKGSVQRWRYTSCRRDSSVFKYKKKKKKVVKGEKHESNDVKDAENVYLHTTFKATKVIKALPVGEPGHPDELRFCVVHHSDWRAHEEHRKETPVLQVNGAVPSGAKTDVATTVVTSSLSANELLHPLRGELQTETPQEEAATMVPAEPEGTFDNSTYRNYEHHSYNPYTFADMDVEMAKYRLPQPTSGRPSPQH
ncbi:uncharacterized protein ndufv3 [Vanacampus margaritifer]